tara:strand:+ start:157 stop:1050 length:894 start_codon:yes stop_codon:yes gene_type:complete
MKNDSNSQVRKIDKTEKISNISALSTVIFIALLLYRAMFSKDLVKWFDSIIAFGSIASLIVLIITLNKVDKRDKKLKKDKSSNALKNIPNFKHTKAFINLGRFIAIDEDSQQIAVKTNSGSNPIVYKYKDILSCEIITDGESVYKKSTARTIGGAVVGGMLSGGAGAIVGGLSGQSTKGKKYKKIQIKLLVKSISNPSIFITFFDIKDLGESKAIDTKSTLYGRDLEKAIIRTNRWKDIMEIVIDKIDNESNTSLKDDINPKTISLSDELLKLNELKEKEILTEAEFNEQKKKLLKQ